MFDINLSLTSCFVQVAAEKKQKKPQEARPRRVPTQARSLRRYEAILAAAADAFADHGFEATTMEGIAARAETSIGSLYQFFPNKMAVFRELAARALAMSRALFAEQMGPEPWKRPWRELVDAMVDGYAKLNQDPTMRAIFGNVQLYGEYADEDAEQLREMTVAIAALIGMWSPTVPARRREVVGALVVNTVATAMVLVSRDVGLADEVVAEIKLLVKRYLAPYADGTVES